MYVDARVMLLIELILKSYFSCQVKKCTISHAIVAVLHDDDVDVP